MLSDMIHVQCVPGLEGPESMESTWGSLFMLSLMLEMILVGLTACLDFVLWYSSEEESADE